VTITNPSVEVDCIVKPLIAVGIAAAIAVPAVGVGTAYAFSGEVPRGTTVLGVDLGGRNRTEAAHALNSGLAARGEQVAKPVVVKVGDQTASVKPTDVGLAVDVDATVAKASKGWPRLFGKRVVDPVVRVDADKLDTALEPTAKKVAHAMTKPAVTFDGLTPKPVYPKAGRGLDPQRSADALTAGWLRIDQVTVPVVDIVPQTTAADVDRLVTELANPAVAAPVAVAVNQTNGKTLTVTPPAIAASLDLTGDEKGKITPKVDAGKLRTALKTPLAQLETPPKDARVDSKIVASTGGEVVDTDKLAGDLLAVLPKGAPRTAAASLVSVAPATSSADLAKLGIKEQVSTFTTYFTGGLNYGRSQNIIRAAQEVDGAIVKPGETFSLNGHTGPRGYEQGYVDAPVIVGGKLTPGVGGGISQFTTTLFNASYYAGMVDVEHQPHQYYFSRYPSVIESTIFYPELDMKFRNDTKYGVLVDTSYTDKSITVSLWSTKQYDVSTEWSPKRDVTQPKPVYLQPGPQCVATDGIPGFTQDAWRIFRQDGKEIKREKFSWRYDAEPKQICGPAPN